MLDKRLESASPLSRDDVVEAEALATRPGLRHAFFTRVGGVSSGLYAGLNVGAGSHDDAEAVRENRSRAAHLFGLSGGDFATPWQVHGTDVVTVDAPFGGERPKADGIVTRTPGLGVGVVTADCGPVLFADAQARVVGAAHAGWRGALGGVLEATVGAMEHLGARRADIVAVLGPTITQGNYEVGRDMADAFTAADPDSGRFFAPGTAPGKMQFDLPGFIVARLSAAGVSAAFVGRCTYAEEDRFFSFRRATHRRETDYGRQLSAIALDG